MFLLTCNGKSNFLVGDYFVEQFIYLFGTLQLLHGALLPGDGCAGGVGPPAAVLHPPAVLGPVGVGAADRVAAAGRALGPVAALLRVLRAAALVIHGVARPAAALELSMKFREVFTAPGFPEKVPSITLTY